jgi:diacylglycerol O-acyltransferase
MFKMHHSVVDGVGSLALLYALTQAGPDDEVLRVETGERRAGAEEAGLLERLGSLAADQARSAAGLVRTGVGGFGRAVREPRAARDDLARTARGLRGLASDMFQPPVVDPLARSTAGISRRLDVTELPLERVRKIKAPLGVTVNDVVLTVFAGALGAYHRKRRASVDELNCMVPMNLRSRSERDDLGNRVGTFNVRLPIGEKRPRERLRRIVEQTRAAKEDQRGAAFPMLAEILPLVPAGAFGWLARQTLGKVNVVCTNVPGVRERRWMAGAGVEAIYPFASPVEGTPVILALLSYAGTLYLGLDTDPEAVPDPHHLTELIAGEVVAMERLAGVAEGG